MTDPRNIAHDKKVQQEKKKHHEEIAPGSEHVPQPGLKPKMVHEEEEKKSDEEGGVSGTSGV